MSVARNVVLVASLVATSALTLMVGATRSPVAHDPTDFLVWNLFLAWIPALLAAAFAVAPRRWSLIPLGLAWLAFLPNAPYLVTDLIHLADGVERWRHVLQYGFAAWTGIVLGIVSLRLVHARMEREFGRVAGWATVLVSVALCAVGVVIGRFQRANSWDLLTDPGAVLAQTGHWMRAPLDDVRSTGVAVAVAAFFGLAYLTIWSIGGMGPRSSAETAVRATVSAHDPR